MKEGLRERRSEMITPASAPPPAIPAPVTAANAAQKKERSTKKERSPECLYAANLRLVGLCLSRFSSLAGADREDAQTAALMGLWSACRHFDPALGFQFSTYATRAIRGYILRHLQKEREQRRLSCVSLETPIGEDGGELADVVADPQAEKPGGALLDEAGFEALLAKLPARQQDVLRGVYLRELGLTEIGAAMGVTKQRAGQFHLAALDTLRKQNALRRQQRAGGGRA